MGTVTNTKKFSSPAEGPGVGKLAACLVPGGLLALLSTTIVGVAIPGISAELDAGLASAQAVTSAYLLAAGVGIVLSGWASRRAGIRGTWLAAIGLFALGAAFAAAAPNLELLVAARAVQGFGGGMLEPVMLSALARAAGPKRMGRVMGSTAAVMSIGPLAGPALGGIISDSLGWRWIFALPAITAVVVLLVSVLVLAAGEREHLALDTVGLGLIATTSVLGLYGLSRAATPAGFGDPGTITLLGGAVLALATFVLWANRRKAQAVIDLRIFTATGFTPAVLIMLLFGVALYPLFFGLPLYYQGVIGLSGATAGLLMVPYGIGNLIAMPLAGFLSDRMDSRRIVWTGTVIAGLGFALLLPTGPDTPLLAFAGISLLTGVGLGSVASPAVASIYRVLRPDLIPSGSTILFFVNQGGGALGVAVLTLLVGTAQWTPSTGTTPLWVPLAATVLTAVAATRLPGASAPPHPTPTGDAAPVRPAA